MSASAPPTTATDAGPLRATAAGHPPPRAHVHPDRDLGWLRRLAPVLRAHAGLFGLAIGTTLLTMIARVATPRVVGEAIDQALDTRNRSLSAFVVVLVVIALVQMVAGFVSRRTIYRVAYRVEYDLRYLVVQHLSRLSIPYFDRHDTGQLLSRANGDVRAIQMFLTFAPLIALSLLTVLAAVGFMVTISVALTLVAVAPLPVVLVLGMRNRTLLFPLSWVTQARQADVATIVEENIAGVRVVRSFAAESGEVDKLARAAARLRWAEVRTADVNARYAPTLENLPRLGLVGVLIYGGHLAADGAIGIGALVAFSSYVVMMQTPFRFLGFIVTMGQRAAASASRVLDVLDEDVEVADRPDAIELTDVGGHIVFDDVSFGYGGGADLLHHFDLEVRPGETVALVGATGCGKSTAARLIPRLYDVRGGSVAIDGVDVRDVTQDSLRRHLGFVSDEPDLFSASIRANIAFGRPDAPLADVRDAAAAAHALEFIERLQHGFDQPVGERGYTLSGGQRQRIALARALLVNPPVLILDDATSAIDVEVEAAIHESLTDLMADRTTLVIAHRLSTIALADRVAFMVDGAVVAEAPHEQLLASDPRYRALLDQLTADEERARAAAEPITPEAD